MILNAKFSAELIWWFAIFFPFLQVVQQFFSQMPVEKRPQTTRINTKCKVAPSFINSQLIWTQLEMKIEEK